MKKVVVFGGSGFLGSYLTQELERRSYHVIVADRQRPSYQGGYNYILCDITSPKNVQDVLSEEVFAVYNLAGFANIEKAIHQPKTTFELNVMGNLIILEACVQAKVSHFVYASSAYAMNQKGSFYGISKLTSEKIIEEFSKKYSLDYTILRYGSVYGEREFDNNYIYRIVQEAIKFGVITHEGDGEEIREYIHASDAAKLSVDIIDNSKDYKNNIYMLTGMERMKRKELFEMIREILSQDVKIILDKDGYKNHYKITPYNFQAEFSKKLVSNPYVDMGQGILECIKAIKNHEPD